MSADLNLIMAEIADIIAKIGCYDINKTQLLHEERSELCQLFKKKIEQARQINNLSRLNIQD
jgi:hypothetical protein